MKKRIFITSGILALLLTVLLVGCAGEEAPPPSEDEYVHGITIQVDGEDYYLSGPADGPNGEQDIPGHTWRLEGSNKLLGNHYNTGPMGASKWWSSDAEDGALLYTVEATIDQWTQDMVEDYVSRGYIHYHELVKVSDGALHPTKVVWLKHTAVMSFNLDGGPHPELSHEVTPGVDLEFIPNGMMPYNP